MRYLLDTHIVIWLADGSPNLNKHILDVLVDKENDVFFSPVNIWEIAIKQKRHKDLLHIDVDKLFKNLVKNDYRELKIVCQHAALVKSLPSIHQDPFDRMLIAQANAEDLVLITQDSKIVNYDVQVLQNKN